MPHPNPIKLVKEAAASVCGDVRRDGYIRAKLLFKKYISHFDSKKDWITQETDSA